MTLVDLKFKLLWELDPKKLTPICDDPSPTRPEVVDTFKALSQKNPRSKARIPRNPNYRLRIANSNYSIITEN